MILLGSAIHSVYPAESISEQQVKAAFLFNFMKFVDWPENTFASAKDPIVIGVIGEDLMAQALTHVLAGKNVNGRNLILKTTKPNDLKGIHILFICEAEDKFIPSALDAIKGQPVLTVSEVTDFTRRGGIINFYTENTKVRFEINIDAAEGAGLKISSKLLSLAKVVRGSSNAARS